MKSLALVIVVAIWFALARLMRFAAHRDVMTKQWLSEDEEKRRRTALEWTGVGYEGRFKR